MDNGAKYDCPFCRAKIVMDDINVSTDIALCRSCGRTSSFSMIVDGPGIVSTMDGTPPKSVRFEDDFSGATIIKYRSLSPMLLFLIPFTAVWSGGSMYGIYITQIVERKFDLARSLFGIPFLIGTVVLASIILFMLFGKWLIRIEGGSGSVFVGIGPLGWRRYFSINTSTVVSLKGTNMSKNGVQQKAILVRTDGVDFTFGTTMKDDAKAYIAGVIMGKIPRR